MVSWQGFDETGFTTAIEFEFGPGFPVMYFSEESFDEDNYISELCNMLDNYENRTEIILSRRFFSSPYAEVTLQRL